MKRRKIGPQFEHLLKSAQRLADLSDAAAVVLLSDFVYDFRAVRKLREMANEIDVETFSADLATVTVRGINIHPSIAKDRMVDAIVIGSRGLSDIKGLFLGSVSHKVGHLAECTCITVK